MPELWVQTTSGLGSRLNAVIGGIAHSEATRRNLVIDWPYNEPSETLKTFEPRLCDLWEHPYTERLGGGHWSGRICNKLTDDGDLRFRTCHIEDFLQWCRDPIGNYFSRMNPTARVQREIDSIAVPSDRPFVGVNIRYSMKQPGAAEPEWFIDRMRQFPENTLFFGSFDSSAVHLQMVDAFPSRVVTMPKNYIYDFNGIVRTCADLYVLQKCDWVIGSNYSSYSQMAAFMRGAEYVGPHDKPNGLRGGRYEDAWNPPDMAAMLAAMTHSGTEDSGIRLRG